MSFLSRAVIAESCMQPLGVESRNVIRDSQLSASSYEEGFKPDEGRLNGPAHWAPASDDDDSGEDNGRNEWFQVDFQTIVKITGLQTQGPNTDDYYTMELQVEYGNHSEIALSRVLDSEGKPIVSL